MGNDLMVQFKTGLSRLINNPFLVSSLIWLESEARIWK